MCYWSWLPVVQSAEEEPTQWHGILGSSAVSTANQTTRLGKGSSVMMQDKRASWRFYYGEIYLEWILKYFIIVSFSSFGLYPIISPIPKLSFVI